ncbi:MAG: hypothetical protein ACE15D_18265 [Candidatus Eisenbacteria bacterium]|nr:hypothetical protein [Candidatus Eisenbacteria bacterium]
MSRSAGVILLFVLSLVFGLVLGQVFFSLFQKTIPPSLIGSFQSGAAHAAFLTYGAGAGIAIAFWSLLMMALLKAFRGKKGAKTKAT